MIGMNSFLRILSPLIFGFLSVCACTIGANAQQIPNIDDQTRVAQCLDAVRKADSDARACLGVVADRCLENPEETSSDETIACLSRETMVWRQLLDDRYGELKNVLDGGDRDELDAVQSAWSTYRDLRCALGYSLYPEGDLAKVTAAECVLDETGRRAIELGALIDDLKPR